MISKIALVVFLISVAVFIFVPGSQPVAGAVAGFAALVGAIALIAEK